MGSPMQDDDVEKIRQILKEVVHESLHGDFSVKPETHYQDHLFITSLRALWERAIAQTGRIMLVGIFILLLGVGIFGIKFLGVKML